MTDESIRAAYEREVRELAGIAQRMRQDGISAETIARTVHAARRALAAKYKALTHDPTRTRIHQRTVAVYGDPLGPTVDYLRQRGRSWDDIIDSATRPGSTNL